MEVKATHRYARISALKARDVAREVTGLPVSTALDILQFTPKKAAGLIGKTLRSAIANAENNHDLPVEALVVKSATVTEGPSMKRWKPRARGGAAPLQKRSSHIFIVLSDEVGRPAPAAKAEPGVEEAPKKKAASKKAAAKKKSAPKKKAAKKKTAAKKAAAKKKTASDKDESSD